MPLTYAHPPRIRVTMALSGKLPEMVTTYSGAFGSAFGSARPKAPEDAKAGGSDSQVYNVTCNSAWRETGEWWAGESEKDFYRVHGDGGFAAVIGRDRDTNEWRLYQLSD